MVDVVAALIEEDGKILIAKRLTGDINVLGKWEFPGGKVKNNETDKQAIEREIKEELEITVEAGDFISSSIYDYTTKKINLKLYKCNILNGIINMHDHSDYAFVDKNKILDYDLCPADIPLAIKVKEID